MDTRKVTDMEEDEFADDPYLDPSVDAMCDNLSRSDDKEFKRKQVLKKSKRILG